jgi:hypothetical protein
MKLQRRIDDSAFADWVAQWQALGVRLSPRLDIYEIACIVYTIIHKFTPFKMRPLSSITMFNTSLERVLGKTDFSPIRNVADNDRNYLPEIKQRLGGPSWATK